MEALVARLTNENEWLRQQLVEMRLAVVALGDKKAAAELEYFKAIAMPPPSPTPTARPAKAGPKAREVYPPPEASVNFTHLMAEGHLEPPVNAEDEEEIVRREAAREVELGAEAK